MIAYLRETVNKRPVPASQICSGGGSVKLFDVLTFTRNRHSIVSIGTQRVGKQIRFVCHTKKIPKPLKGLGIKECRWWGSNPYGVTTNGFWVRLVCQFQHTGVCRYFASIPAPCQIVKASAPGFCGQIFRFFCQKALTNGFHAAIIISVAWRRQGYCPIAQLVRAPDC